MSFEEAKKLDDHFVMHTFNRKPVMLVEGSGMEVKDDEGKTYLDFIAGIGAVSYTHLLRTAIRWMFLSLLVRVFRMTSSLPFCKA